MPKRTAMILQAKLQRPRVSSDLIVRPRLLDRLDQGLDRQLTLVCAPAGFGKTTLVSSWIKLISAGSKDQHPCLPAAWLSLDKTDSELNTFLKYFISALRTVDPSACDDTLTLIFAGQRPPQELLVASLSNDLARMEGGIVLVLDDFHNIRGNSVADFLSELLKSWPPGFHLVLVSRTTPPLPLARLRANDDLIEFRSSDLRFSVDETAAFIDRTFQTNLDQASLLLLDEKLEGWIAGLRLAGLSMRKAGANTRVLAHLLSTDAHIADYLVEEVFSQQVPAVQTFLLKTSILESFSAPLCAAVLGEVDPAWDMQASIAWLERAGLFVTPLGESGTWYRYHQIFRDVLQNRLLMAAGPDSVADLHCRAATWFAEQGIMEEAILHSLEAGDLDMTARLMKQGMHDVLDSEDRSTMERWLSYLSEEAIQRQPWLLLVKAWVLSLSWQLRAVAKVCRQIESLIADSNEADFHFEDMQILRGQLQLFRAQEEYHSNHPENVIEICQDVLSILPPSWRYARGSAMFYLGLSMLANGEGRAAESLLREEYESLIDKTDAYALRLLFGLCFIYLQAGRLEQVMQTATKMSEQADIRNMPVIQNWARFMQGVVYFYWNELENAEKQFAEIVSNRYIAQVASVRDAFNALILIHQIRGESRQASQRFNQLSQLDMELGAAEEVRTQSLGAKLMLMQGDRDSAYRWADSFTEPVPDRSLIWLEIPHLTRAHILKARNQPKDRQTAIQILEALYEIVKRTYNTRYQFIVLTQLALALEADGKSKEALAALEQALELSRPGDFIRVYLDLGEPMRAMLASLYSINHLAEPVRHVLATFPAEESQISAGGNGASPVSTPGLVEPLTRRELEILELMREPMSIKEIASELSISPQTVKRHSINLYGKLGVHRRWEAVAIATTMGILPPR